jgi:CO/xanthine dehydrogenase Mo-binding subunit
MERSLGLGEQIKQGQFFRIAALRSATIVISNADIGTIDVSCVNLPDIKLNPLGARGIGEIGITGTSAAVANAIFHATGKRARHLPITLDN